MWEAITLYNRSMDIRRLREEFAILIHSLLVHTPPLCTASSRETCNRVHENITSKNGRAYANKRGKI